MKQRRRPMAYDVELFLIEKYLKTGDILLEAKGCDEVEQWDFEKLDRGSDESALLVSVNTFTGEVLEIELEGFVEETERAIKMLREYPLPWTFSLPQMNIKEKPLEDVLLAIWKKYKNDEW